VPRSPGARTEQNSPLPEPTTVLHTSFAHSLLRHWAERLQVAPVSRSGVQAPVVPQNSPFGHSLSFVQREPPSPTPASLEMHIPVVVLHVGASVSHMLELVHCTQVLVVVLHTGVPAGHSELVVQATQSPPFGPVVAQKVDRQSVVPSVAVHGPSPLA